MASKRVPDLTLLQPDTLDSIVVYDVSADTTKRSLVSNMIESFRILSANEAGTNVNTAQPLLPTVGSFTVTASTMYELDGYFRISRAAGSTSHTTSVLFGGSATLTGIAYQVLVNTGDAVANIATNQVASEVATATVIKAASTSTTEQIAFRINGIVRVNAGGTFIPQFIYSAAPGGVPTVLANSFFKIRPLGTNTAISLGSWS